MKKVFITGFVGSFLVIAGMAATAQSVTSGAKLTSEFPGAVSNEDTPNLKDNNLSTKFLIVNKPALWFQYELVTPAAVNQYAISSANDVPERDPKSWTLRASNDGQTWKDLDVRKDEKFENRKITKTYSFDNKVAYKFYRLYTQETNGVPHLQFSEWNLAVIAK